MVAARHADPAHLAAERASPTALSAWRSVATMPPPAPVPFRIALDAAGRGTVEVDGRDVTDQVGGLRFDAATGEVPRLTVQTYAAGTIEGEAIVEVHQDRSDAADVIRSLDAATVERQAINRSGWGTDSLTSLVLDIVAEALDGS